MKLALLHTLAGYAPLGCVEIKLCVFHFAQLARSHENVRSELEGCESMKSIMY
jgi:hypothetical protein